MSEVDCLEYTDSHRYFVQAMMIENQISLEMANEIYAQLDHEGGLQQLVHQVNSKLHSLDFDIQKVTDHTTSLPVYILINTNNDELSKLATDFTPHEIPIVKQMLEYFIEHRFYASSIELVNSFSNKRQASELLQKLKNGKWVLNGDRGLVLSMRTVYELKRCLDFDSCSVCEEVLSIRKTCSSCQTGIHRHCYDKIFANKDDPTCPECKKPFQ